jgi:hypothetical protein
MYNLLHIPKVNNEWPGLTWQQCLLGSKLPCKLEKVTPIWSLICGSVIWLCWIDRNAIFFVNNNWSQVKMEHFVCEAFLDHARTAWYRTKWMIKQQLRKMVSFLAAFDKVWMHSCSIGHRQDLEIQWNFIVPNCGMINWS